MTQRCPESKLIGLGRLKDWYWIINDRHYANVVQVSESNIPPQPDFPDSWGLVYRVTEKDLKRLDVNEGVPVAYVRKAIKVDLWDAQTIEEQRETGKGVEDLESTSVNMWVYINTKRTKPSYPYDEYIYRMNMGITDALELGMPDGYTMEVLRKYIPEQDVDDDEEEIAKEQAKNFQDPEDAEVSEKRT